MDFVIFCRSVNHMNWKLAGPLNNRVFAVLSFIRVKGHLKRYGLRKILS